MKPAVLLAGGAIAFACAALSFTSPARADETAAPALDESADAWLHDHCAYRGLGLLLDSSSAGRVVETVGAGASSFHKAFVCAERPPFWQGPWSAATAEAVACTELRKSTDVCVPPLVSVAEPPLATASVSSPPARRLPPKMPEPAPPKRHR